MSDELDSFLVIVTACVVTFLFVFIGFLIEDRRKEPKHVSKRKRVKLGYPYESGLKRSKRILPK